MVRERLTNPPINNGRSVMDSFYGRRVWSADQQRAFPLPPRFSRNPEAS